MRKLILSVIGGILCSSFTIIPQEPNKDDRGHQAITTSSSAVSPNTHFLTNLGQYLQKQLCITVINSGDRFSTFANIS